MTIVDHLDEFRSRILIVLATIIVLTIAGFFLSDHLLDIVMAPFLKAGQKLNIFTLAGGFVIRLKISVIAALLVGLPLLGFHLWRYIVPAIAVKDRMFSRISLLIAGLLFYTGVAFVFFVILPMAIPMFLSFIGDDMISTIGADDYLSFLLIFAIAMGFLFELPIVIMILTKIGLLTPTFLMQKRKYAIVAIWIIAALVTPQDILSQIMVAVPMMLLYEISIVISKMMVIRKKKQELMKR
jgi:sec-independent protein translocase protein TatC